MADPLSYFFIFAGQSVLSIAAFVVAAELYIWSDNRRRIRRRHSRFDLRGKSVLVTGASSGLGRALAREFYLAGAKVIVTARSLGKLKELCDELMQIGSSSQSVDPKSKRQLFEPSVNYLDLADSSSIAEAVTDILKITGGRLDVLVNNAGISMRGSCEDTSMAVHRQLMEINYFGQIELTQSLLPALANAAGAQDPSFPGPCIVCISSIQGRLSIPYRSAYSASKHAFQAYFDCLRSELAVTNAQIQPKVRVLVVSPGYLVTNLSLNAMTGDGTRYGKMDETTKRGMHPDCAAKQIVRGVRECREEILLASCVPRLGVILRSLFPTWYFWWAARKAKEKQK